MHQLAAHFRARVSMAKSRTMANSQPLLVSLILEIAQTALEIPHLHRVSEDLSRQQGTTHKELLHVIKDEWHHYRSDKFGASHQSSFQGAIVRFGKEMVCGCTRSSDAEEVVVCNWHQDGFTHISELLWRVDYHATYLRPEWRRRTSRGHRRICQASPSCTASVRIHVC